VGFKADSGDRTSQKRIRVIRKYLLPVCSSIHFLSSVAAVVVLGAETVQSGMVRLMSDVRTSHCKTAKTAVN
jgi:hypothetical protein